jgi:two-component system sensor histidine kinase AlgZ
MQGLLSSRRGIALYLTAWLFLGMALGGVITLLGDAHPINAMLFAVPLCAVYAFAVGYSSYYLCRAYPLGSARARAIPWAFSVAALVSGVLWLALGQAWNSLCQMLAVDWAGVPMTRPLSALIVGLGVLLYVFAAAVHYVVLEFVRAQGAEQRELQSLLMAQEAELRMLRTQIDPHFLFNSLNSISALTAQNPKAARRMTLELASFFRQSLGMEAHRKVTLEQELVLIRHFLAIEQVRFGERLQVAEQIGDGALACLVPPMIIQPLVENAVKHGICNLTDGGTIVITAQLLGSVLRIRIDNPVDADPAPYHPSSGIGLVNVRQRLAGAYGHEASIHWGGQREQFGVEISMPAQTTQGEL